MNTSGSTPTSQEDQLSPKSTPGQGVTRIPQSATVVKPRARTWTVFGVFTLDEPRPLGCTPGRRAVIFTDLEDSTTYPDGAWKVVVVAATPKEALLAAKRSVACDVNDAVHRNGKRPHQMTESAWKEVQILLGQAALDSEDTEEGTRSQTWTEEDVQAAFAQHEAAASRWYDDYGYGSGGTYTSWTSRGAGRLSRWRTPDPVVTKITVLPKVTAEVTR